MNFAAIRFGGVGLSLALFAPATAFGLSVRGEMGAQSQAAVRISVSVAPRFDVARAATAANPIIFDGANAGRSLAVASNAPGLRYTVQPIGGATCPADSAAERARQDLAGTCASPAQSAKPERAGPLVLMVIPD